MNEPLKDCCSQAIVNYRKNEALKHLQCVAEFDTELEKDERKLLMAFLEGMKINQ